MGVMMGRSDLISITIAGEEAIPLAGSEPFGLSCDKAGCLFNCCTKSAPIVLNPYEIAMICRASGLLYEDLLDILDTGRDRGFPLVMLPRDPACHFWSGSGCRIYEARPLACRLFPLGRVFYEGRSHIVLPPRNACVGIIKDNERTVADYLRDQDIHTYIQMADRWIEFVSRMENIRLPDRPVTSVAFHLLVYSPDTPPFAGARGQALDQQESFMLRLANAEKELPRFLNTAS